MPVPSTYNSIVRLVTPSDLATMNAEILAQNNADYWLTDIQFFDATTCLMLFGKTEMAGLSEDPLIQVLNQVTMTQVAIDLDVVTQFDGGYLATGIFPDTFNSILYINYANIGSAVSP